MKVTTSCYNRFHIFDQAVQLHKHGVLYRLINDYPKFMTRRWGITDDLVISLLTNGIYGRIAKKSYKWLKPTTQSQLLKSVHDKFSKRLAKYVPLESDIFIGLSSFCIEAIEHAKEKNMITIVDHGSLHQRVERQLQIEESERWGLPKEGNLPPEWIIEKEDREFHAADRVMVLSQIAKQSMIKAGVPAEKIFVNQCGVNLEEFKLGKKEEEVFRVIQCGGLHQRKGVQYLLKAFTELELPKSELWFIGGGLETTSLRPIIKKYQTDNVYFKGSFPQNQLYKLYTQGSVFVLASIADGFGMVVPQAMACGLPVIVTEHVGAADIVTDGKTGFVIPIRDIDALKQKLLFFYQNQNMGHEMGLAAYQSVKNGQTWDDYGNRLVDFLRSLYATRH
jgi:glycosyltransferase involved in cell wall biosynthesis